ncbi:MAG: hypothetical protein M9939_17670 [Mesorhizobium sp.]|nr:hypothetical protein [Mesorhizobium sp.]MCO5162968.1 hypothetical protein [Mesorhizobium sp.]
MAVPSMSRADTEIIDSAFGTCGVVNCSATRIAGYLGSFGASHQPWVGKFLAIQGNCLRLQVGFVSQAVPLEMVVVGPSPLTSYRNIANRPLVKIDPAPASGFYTVVISSSTGAPLNVDFHLLFGQYNAGNINCSSPTPPVP